MTWKMWVPEWLHWDWLLRTPLWHLLADQWLFLDTTKPTS
jgi:hypothetical protein